MSELWNPVLVEQRLTALITELTKAQRSLAEARDHEVDAKHIYKAARRRVMLGPDCPKVTRGGPTVADRDAWVDDQTADLERAYDTAVARREAAQDHLRVVRDQAEIVRSLGVSVRQAYEMAGTAP